MRLPTPPARRNTRILADFGNVLPASRRKTTLLTGWGWFCRQDAGSTLTAESRRGLASWVLPFSRPARIRRTIAVIMLARWSQPAKVGSYYLSTNHAGRLLSALLHE
jgi:hypothetical protein